MATPTLRQLRTFLAVVEAGSVSAAARLLNFTQPAASQQLRELERALSVRLLDRAGGRVIPTAAGQALLDSARRAQAAAEDAITATAEHRRGDTGRVRLGTGATACILLGPSAFSVQVWGCRDTFRPLGGSGGGAARTWRGRTWFA